MGPPQPAAPGSCKGSEVRELFWVRISLLTEAHRRFVAEVTFWDAGHCSIRAGQASALRNAEEGDRVGAPVEGAGERVLLAGLAGVWNVVAGSSW